MGERYARRLKAEKGLPRRTRRTQSGRVIAQRALQQEKLEDRVLLAVGPQLISVQPNFGDVLRDGAIRDIAPQELTFVFDENQNIDSSTLAGIRILRAGFDSTFDGVTDIIVEPGYVGVDATRANEVHMRFAETLPDDLYRIEVLAIDDENNNFVALRNESGDVFQPAVAGNDRTRMGFELDLGAQIIAVIPQPIDRNEQGELTQASDRIEIFFNEDDLNADSASNPAFYELIFTNDTVTNTDDVIHNPASVEYDAERNLVSLTFASNLDELSTGPGTYRLRVGTDEAIPEVPVVIAAEEDAGSSFGTAMELGALDTSKIINGAIDPDGYPLDYPGANNEPGHRDIEHIQGHYWPIVLGAEKDEFDGLMTIEYNFREDYGTDPEGNELFNLITENQKQRTREIFDIYSYYLGVQFTETPDRGLTIVNGDLRVLDPGEVVGPLGTVGLAGLHPVTEEPIAIMDSSELWDDSFGESLDPDRVSWFDVTMHEIGHLLGAGHTDELPPLTLQNNDLELAFSDETENIFPGDHDIVHGRYLHRTESNDIDMYRFELETPGVFAAEIIAERRAETSHLDSVITLYREEDGRRSMIARNDDYFSEDSFVSMPLDAGVYYIGVTSTGNVDFDATVENSGFGGTSQGAYDLRLDFRPRVDNFLTDATGTAFDGDADGVPGGIFDFWFKAVAPQDQVIVDKSAAAGGDGSLQNPLNNLNDAMSDPDHGVQPDQILRIVGNGGADGDLATLADNLAYEIGLANGNILSDGADFILPKGVTVMIDEGAIFKMYKTNMQVGSSSVTIDRSESALQVLGSPEHKVIFTSYDDQETGVDTNPRITSPNPGDWGGIIIQNDVDRNEMRFDYEQVGIYLNHVGQADMRYGGGNVTVNSIQQVIDPIHMIAARPTISYNTITNSADSAISADPDSFEETNFSAPDSLGVDYQETPFTPDYDRVGPDIRGNHLVNNSINGMFIRISTPATEELERMTVTGRWDDTDVVHVVPENLIIEGRAGGLVEEAGELRSRTDAGLKIDPSIVVKLDGSRIEASFGAQLLAEGLAGQEIIMTSLQDVRYGAGGTFRTNSPNGEDVSAPEPGDWGGIYIAPTSQASIDYAVIAYGGGLTRVEGSFAGFNAVETRQGFLRLTHSVLENNADGRGGQSEPTREGRGVNESATIFVRGAQPIIAANVMRGNDTPNAAAISINVNSLNHELKPDIGRATGPIEVIEGVDDNRGALVRYNRLEDNGINGMVVRGQTLTTEVVWDDTDIVHVLYDEVVIPDLHTYGGLRLQSSSTESLVIKMRGELAGFKATGRPLDIDDRVGGTLHVVGQPGRPVIMTSLSDDTVGAGLTPSGSPQNQTDGSLRPDRDELPGSFQIDLNFGPIISGRPQVMAAVEEAERIWEQLVQDPISVTFDIEIADLGDGILGLAFPETTTVNYDTFRRALINDAGPQEAFVSGLPTFEDLSVTFPDDPGNPYSVSSTMSVNTANAKAAGIDPAFIFQPPSAFDPTETRDGLIRFNADPYSLNEGGGEPGFFDYDRSNGIQPSYTDFVAVAVHEIGHALGFVSGVSSVDGGAARLVQMQPLDLFRFEPGDASVDFTTAPRVLDPSLEHVFYDGGVFDSSYIPIPGLRRGDIPLSSGSTAGDGAQPGHWKDGYNIGLMDPTAQDGEANLTEADRTAFDLIGYDVVGDGVPGDWRGITLDQNSNDRNVAIFTELEAKTATAPGTNALPATAEFLGVMGRGEKNSDDNVRLGFEVHGYLNAPNDVDVYSFNARAASEVWIDIDRTSSALDTVVELTDANGRVLVRSDNSLDESGALEPDFVAEGINAYIMQKSVFRPEDFWTTNPKDAGFRVVLPGAADSVGTYHVRVRSAGDNLDDISSGLTKGVYQLQVRLQDLDEFGGSTVQYADIRYAVDGVRVKGMPKHSPLQGEVSEHGGLEEINDTTAMPLINGESVLFVRPPVSASPGFQDAQYLGNVLATDRAAISLAGTLDSTSANEEDWYLFDVEFQSIQTPGGNTADLILDLDYADGLSRADTSIAIFEAESVFSGPYGPEWVPSQLIYTSEDSNVGDDRPAPLSGDNLDDLSRGSVGPLDPFLGPISLAEGTYLLKVWAAASGQPCAAGQFTERLPCNTYVRAEPNDSLVRIVDDHIGDEGPLVTATFDDPVVPVFVNARSPVPYTLSDVELFVSTSTSMFTVDGFTGQRETALGSYTGPFFPTVGDFALRDNPIFDPASDNPDVARRQRFYAYSVSDGANPPTDATTGAYLWLDVDPTEPNLRLTDGVLIRGTGEEGAFTDDGFRTFVDLNATANPPPDPPATTPSIGPANEGEGVGFQFDAMTFALPGPSGDIEFGYAVGRRLATPTELNYDPPENTRHLPNVFFRFEAITGVAQSSTGAERAEEDRIPMGNPPLRIDPAYPFPAERPNAGTQIVESGVMEVSYVQEDGTEIFGGNITGIDFVGSRIYGVSDEGHLYRITGQDGPGTRARYVASITDEEGEFVEFNGLTAGPPNADDGRYSDVLFGIARNGDLYAFDIEGVPQPVFVDGQTWISTGIGGAVGLEFGTVDENLWHITPARGEDPGHTAGNSFYFGEDNVAPNLGRHYDFLGGAHGSLVSNEFSLAGYTAADVPRLYFTYHLSTEEGFAPTARDTFRVFISDNSREDNPGQWHLLASNNPGELGDVTDLFPDDDIVIDVQQLYDNTWQDVPFQQGVTFIRNGNRDPFPYPDAEGQRPFDPQGTDWQAFDPPLNETETVWRQARLDLTPFAGQGDLRLRFDFSTAGSFNIGGARTTGGAELYAKSGDVLRDGDTFVIDEEVFEFDMGFTLEFQAAVEIPQGETIRIGDDAEQVTYEFTRDGVVAADNVPVEITDDLSAAEVAVLLTDAIVANGPASVIPHWIAERVNLEGATALLQSPNAVIAVEGSPGVAIGRPVVIHSEMDESDVAEAMVQPIADAFAEGITDVIKFHGPKVQIIGHEVTDQGPLGLSAVLPGDALGSFNTRQRFEANTQVEYGGGGDDEEGGFNVLQEGVYVDDILIGFAGQGEELVDLRPPQPTPGGVPDVFEIDATATSPTPDSGIEFGEYQLEIRRASQFTLGGEPERTFDPRDRLTRQITLSLPSGAEVFDGKTFTFGDGLRSVVFEYENSRVNDGVEPGHIALPFDVTEPDYVLAPRLRDLINAPEFPLDIIASLSGTVVTGQTTSDRVDLYGNVFIQREEFPNGISFMSFDEYGTGNPVRDQGQVIVHSNTIQHSRQYGIVVEDGLRDLPEYTFYDPIDEVKDAQFNTGDYTPHSGSVRNLREINKDELVPGVTITNNVVAFNNHGGIHYSGDPNGFILIGPVVGDTAEARNGFQFNIVDHHGTSQTFQFVAGGATRNLANGIIPVQWQPVIACPNLHLIDPVTPIGQECSSRYDLGARDTTDALMHAIDSSNLDVSLLRGRGHEIFVEGAAEIIGVAPPLWIDAFVEEVQIGSVPYGRIINNTVVGMGGSLETENLYEEDDFRDVGIYLEDNANPTVMNNVVVNFKQGIGTDLTIAAESTIGGTVYQGNYDNAVNTDIGDFPITIDNEELLFVDREAGNFYPSVASGVIDSALDSLEDRPNLVTVKNPHDISSSPVLAPEFDVLGQLRADDPSVEPSGGLGENVFKDRGAIDRVDFAGPTAQLVRPADNDADGVDQNPETDKVRVENANLTSFIVRVVDLGESGAATGTGVDDDSITVDSVVLTRDGIPLLPGLDYRFDYQRSSDEILLTPQAGIWLPGFNYEIELVNLNRYVLATAPADQIPDGFTFEITDEDGLIARFEFESGYTLEMPEPLTLFVPAGNSGLSAVEDGQLFTLSNGARLVTYEFDSDGEFSAGRIPIQFNASETPDVVADAIVDAIKLADLDLAPQSLGGGLVHVGGPSSTLLDTSLTSLQQQGMAGAILNAQTFTIEDSQQLVTFEFDNDGALGAGNIGIEFTDNDTQLEIADAVAAAIQSAAFASLEPLALSNGQVHLGGTPDVTISPQTANISVLGEPGLETTGARVSPIVYIPSPEVDQRAVAELMLASIQASALSNVFGFVDSGNEVALIGADEVDNIPNALIEGIRDRAGNKLQTNQDNEPFSVVFEIDLPAPLDFGDTPDPPYATLLSENGARHVVVPNVYLGQGVDAELDAKTSPDASGDLFDDGVSLLGTMAPGASVPIEILASTAGFVDAWVDFGGDGSFDSVDQVLSSSSVNRGLNSLQVDVPADAMIGNTFARFRFSTSGGLQPSGRADNGEVEDYQMVIEDIQPPISVDDSYVTEEDVLLEVAAAEGVLANDTDPQADPLTATLVSDVANGELVFQSDGSFTYQPRADFFGFDSFSYVANSSILSSQPAVVTLEVVAIPDPPVATDDEVTTPEDTPLLIDLGGNDFDPDGALDPTTVTVVTPAENGEVLVNPDGTALYSPSENFVGIDTFQYTVRDLSGVESNVATVTVTVEKVNDPPVAVDDSLSTQQGVAQTIDVLANDFDPDGELNPESVVITLSPKSGFVRVNGDGTVTFTPSLSFLGTDTFRYTVRDDEDAVSNEAVVTVNVSDQNSAPIANDDQASTSQGESVTINVIANDVDADGAIIPGSVSIVAAPANGQAVSNVDGTVTYTPDSEFVGVDSFQYNVRDEFNAISNNAFVTVEVNSITPSWQNPSNPLDVDNNGVVVPLDALLVINELNANGSRPLDPPPSLTGPVEPPPYLDVNGDGFLSPIDALQVINALNNLAAAQPVAAVAAQSTIVGAALDIEPRFPVVLEQREAAIEQAFDEPSSLPLHWDASEWDSSEIEAVFDDLGERQAKDDRLNDLVLDLLDDEDIDRI